MRAPGGANAYRSWDVLVGRIRRLRCYPGMCERPVVLTLTGPGVFL
ncbi:hypothetical protein CKO_02039 [Citrobacter koseri ATCC BAA-895]|uniref:Uncharacterized protein n=1 Tax=Citrobacter koseri (strain ATCC BAA-895 / CDC 4225-83 / SGSC4696) TaxID=290338 RepID=A8AI51_CITK8|nr:hypothetical protein CKO_02039 [Citrobacter koseri ATCC BAA-895]